MEVNQENFMHNQAKKMITQVELLKIMKNLSKTKKEPSLSYLI